MSPVIWSDPKTGIQQTRNKYSAPVPGVHSARIHPLEPHTPPSAACQRVAALAAGYRLDQSDRSHLADLLVPRIMSMYNLLRDGHGTGTQPWARLWDEGHGHVWLNNAEYSQRHLGALREALVHSA